MSEASGWGWDAVLEESPVATETKSTIVQRVDEILKFGAEDRQVRTRDIWRPHGPVVNSKGKSEVYSLAAIQFGEELAVSLSSMERSHVRYFYVSDRAEVWMIDKGKEVPLLPANKYHRVIFSLLQERARLFQTGVLYSDRRGRKVNALELVR